jgi:hypothetical protein
MPMKLRARKSASRTRADAPVVKAIGGALVTTFAVWRRR